MSLEGEEGLLVFKLNEPHDLLTEQISSSRFTVTEFSIL